MVFIFGSKKGNEMNVHLRWLKRVSTFWRGSSIQRINCTTLFKRSGKKQTNNNFYKNNDTFETK